MNGNTVGSANGNLEGNVGKNITRNFRIPATLESPQLENNEGIYFPILKNSLQTPAAVARVSGKLQFVSRPGTDGILDVCEKPVETLSAPCLSDSF